MNPADPQHPWARLAAAARQARDERDATAPHGFATRVAARAMAANPWPASLLEHFALRAVGVACLLALLSVALNYEAVTHARGTARPHPADDLTLPVDDAIVAALDLG